MPGETVAVLGAGATKACDGPLTNEILPWAFSNAAVIEREGYVDLAARFIEDIFGIDPRGIANPESRIPSLTLILSLIDIALDRREALGPKWQHSALADARGAFDYIIFAVLEQHLIRITHNPHVELFKRLGDACGELRVLSLNYDIIADNSMVKLAEMQGEAAFPDYGFDVASAFYRDRPKIGRLLKLHGSLNWMYCPNCFRVELGVSQSGRYTAKVLDDLYNVGTQAETLEHRYTCHGSPCTRCGTFVEPMLISPSFQKDYRNPHTVQIWREADAMLRDAQRLIFIGYSLPEDDIHVQYLLKRAAGHLTAPQVTVVELDDTAPVRPALEHPVGRRYAWLFGETIDWHPEGFIPWLAQPGAV
jgi:hypothetical protein